MQEVVARLMAREALAALERQELGVEDFGIPAGLRPLSQRFGEALGLVVSNANLSEVRGWVSSGICTVRQHPSDRHLLWVCATLECWKHSGGGNTDSVTAKDKRQDQAKLNPP